jgi:hypothetical protein
MDWPGVTASNGMQAMNEIAYRLPNWPSYCILFFAIFSVAVQISKIHKSLNRIAAALESRKINDN